jgi:thiamine biosynthesis lipoprotein
MLSFAWLVFLQSAVPPTPEAGLVERRLAAMGTWLELAARAPQRELALAASEAAVRALEECEGRISTWRTDSELARFNSTAVGQPFELSSSLADELTRVAFHWRTTGGTFDPGIGALVEIWGLRTGGREPSPEELEGARSVGGFAAIELGGGRAVRNHPLARIEEGGFGKGLGLDWALSAARKAGATAVRLDLGGQVLVFGDAAEVRLADPDERERAVLALTLASGSLATSGNSERGIVVAGERRGHVLDPVRGQPAPDFGSLSVWAPDALAADCLSTGLYVMGPEKACAWRAACAGDAPRVELVLLLRSEHGLRAVVTAGLRAHVRALVSELVVEVVPDSPSSLSGLQNR